MLKRILNWRWLLPSFTVMILLIILIQAWFSGWDEFRANLFTLLVLGLGILTLAGLRHYRPDTFNAYFNSWIDGPAQQSPDVISALEQLTLAVEQCDDGHTPKPIHEAAARARALLDKHKPRS